MICDLFCLENGKKFALKTYIVTSTLSVQADYIVHTQSGGISILGFRFGPYFGLRRLVLSWAFWFWEVWARNIIGPWVKAL